MKETITEKNIELGSNLILTLNTNWIFHHMIGEDIKIKSQIINAATDKFGFNKVKECIVDDFEGFGYQHLYDMLNHLRNNEKKVSEYMNVSRGVLNRLFGISISRLSKKFVHSEQFEQLKTEMISDIRKCKTRNQMLELFQADPKTPIVIGFLKYCVSGKNLVTE